MEKQKGRIIHLDIIRVICMIWVIALWHMRNYTQPLNWNLISIQTMQQITFGCLAMFTFLSGYLAGGKRISSVQNALSFYWNRIIRLYPLYFLSCISLWVVHMIDKKQLITSILLVGELVGNPPSTIWFINMIFLFYFFTPLLNAVEKPGRKIIIILTIGGIWYVTRKFCGTDIRLEYYWPFYSLGICANSFRFFQEKIMKEQENLISMVIGLILCAMAAGLGDGEFTILSYLCCISWGIFVLELSKILSRNKPVTKIIDFLAYSSMCAYLFHRAVFSFFQICFGNVHQIIAWMLILPLLFLFSFIVQKVYDIIVQFFL